MKLDFEELSFSLLAFSQLPMLSNLASSWETIFTGDIFFLNLQVRVLSSANKVNLKNSEQLGKSLMNIRKSKGPRMDPWGTPLSIR